MISKPRTAFLALLAWTALALCAPAQAETYRIDLIVFLDGNTPEEAGLRPAMPSSENVLSHTDTTALAAAGIQVLPDEQFGLQQEWQRLRNARRYQPLLRMAWTQVDPPAERGPALQVKFGPAQAVAVEGSIEPVTMSPVEGSIALLLNRYLMIDTDLAYTLPTSEGHARYALRERRRMRRDELHYLDSPKLGVIARVSKAQP